MQERLSKLITSFDKLMKGLGQLASLERSLWPMAQRAWFVHLGYDTDHKFPAYDYLQGAGLAKSLLGVMRNRRRTSNRSKRLSGMSGLASEPIDALFLVRSHSWSIYETIAVVARELKSRGIRVGLLLDSSPSDPKVIADAQIWATSIWEIATKYCLPNLQLYSAVKESWRRSVALSQLFEDLHSDGYFCSVPRALLFQTCLDAHLTEHWLNLSQFGKNAPLLLVSALDIEPEAMTIHTKLQELGVSGIVLQHGLAHVDLFPSAATWSVVYGPRVISDAIEWGKPVEKMIALGCPRFDPNYWARLTRLQSPLSVHSKRVLFLSTFSQASDLPFELNLNTAKLLVELATKLQHAGGQLIFRPRNGDCQRVFRKYLDGSIPNCIVFSSLGRPLLDEIQDTDLVISVLSTGLVEAMQAGLPVILLWPIEGEPWAEYYDTEYVPVARSADQVFEFLVDLCNQPSFVSKRISIQDEWLADRFSNPGKATRVVTDWLMRLIEQGRHHRSND